MDEVGRQAADLSATDFYELAQDRLRVGEPPQTIENELVARGLAANAAKRVVVTAQETRKQRIQSSARRNMIFGTVAFVGGIVATAMTYSLAAENSGVYFIFWAAIVFGAIQFVWGVLRRKGS